MEFCHWSKIIDNFVIMRDMQSFRDVKTVAVTEPGEWRARVNILPKIRRKTLSERKGLTRSNIKCSLDFGYKNE